MLGHPTAIQQQVVRWMDGRSAHAHASAGSSAKGARPDQQRTRQRRSNLPTNLQRNSRINQEFYPADVHQKMST